MTIKPVYQNINHTDLAKYAKSFLKEDEDILCSAKERAILKTQNNAITKAQKVLPYMAVGALAVASAAKTPGKLSNKMMSASRVLGTYVMIDVLFDALKRIGGFLNKKQKDNEAEDNRSNILNTIATIGAGFIGINLLFKGANKIVNKIIEQKPETTAKVINGIKEGFETFNKTKFASKIENFKPIYNDFALKHPKITSKISHNIFPIILTSFIGGEIALTSKNNKNREEIFTQSVTSDVIKREYAKQITESPISEISKD